MRFKYGNYTHPTGECLVSYFGRRTTFNQRDRPERSILAMVVQGEIVADGQAAIDARMSEIQNAYALDGGSATFLRSDGTATRYVLPGVGAIRGPSVVELAFHQEDAKAHFATGLPFTIRLEAEYFVSDGDPVIAYEETYRLIGTGGPRVVWQELDQGAPVAQVVSTQTPVVLLQSGFVVATSALGAYRNEPMFPEAIASPEDYQIGSKTPRLSGNVFTEFGSDWSYRMTFGGAIQLPTPNIR